VGPQGDWEPIDYTNICGLIQISQDPSSVGFSAENPHVGTMKLPVVTRYHSLHRNSVFSFLPRNADGTISGTFVMYSDPNFTNEVTQINRIIGVNEWIEPTAYIKVTSSNNRIIRYFAIKILLCRECPYEEATVVDGVVQDVCRCPYGTTWFPEEKICCPAGSIVIDGKCECPEGTTLDTSAGRICRVPVDACWSPSPVPDRRTVTVTGGIYDIRFPVYQIGFNGALPPIALHPGGGTQLYTVSSTSPPINSVQLYFNDALVGWTSLEVSNDADWCPCPPGTTWNSVLKECECNEPFIPGPDGTCICPPGTVWNAATGTCAVAPFTFGVGDYCWYNAPSWKNIYVSGGHPGASYTGAFCGKGFIHIGGTRTALPECGSSEPGDLTIHLSSATAPTFTLTLLTGNNHPDMIQCDKNYFPTCATTYKQNFHYDRTSTPCNAASCGCACDYGYELRGAEGCKPISLSTASICYVTTDQKAVRVTIPAGTLTDIKNSAIVKGVSHPVPYRICSNGQCLPFIAGQTQPLLFNAAVTGSVTIQLDRPASASHVSGDPVYVLTPNPTVGTVAVSGPCP